MDVHRPQRKRCLWFNRDVLRYVSEHPEVTTVILTARWALSAHGERYKREEGNSFSLVDLHADHRQEENRVVLQRGLERTLDTLRDLDRKVVLVAQIPEVGYEVGAAYAIAHRTGRDLNQIIAPSVDEYRLRNQSVRELFARLENRQGLTILYPQEKICGPLLCSVVLDGKPLYRDNNHLSIFGSHFVAPIFDAVLTH